MHSNHEIFNRQLYRHRKARFASSFRSHYDFLHREAEWRVMERLDAINRNFEKVLIIGAVTPLIFSHPRVGKVLWADEMPARLPAEDTALVLDHEWLPFGGESLDAIISIFSLHHVNDLPGCLIQMQRALKPDGLFLAILPGARSLIELRDSFAQAEAMKGGISPRISPFVEVRDAGSLLQRAGFALPVVDSEILTLSYASMFNLMQELRKSGEGNILKERVAGFTPKSMLMDAAAYYQSYYADKEEEGRIRVTAELLCLTAWKPAPTQQQPAKRGSGQVSLKDVF